MNVVFWFPNYLPDLGGVQWTTHRLLLELKQLGVKSCVYARDNLGGYLTDHVLGVHRISGQLEEFVCKSAREIVSRPDIDVVHVIDLFKAGHLIELATLRLLAKRGTPTVLRILTLGIARQFINTPAKRRVLRQISAIVVLNQEMRRELEQCGALPERIHYHPNAVNLDLFRPASPAEKYSIRRKLGLPPDALIVTYIGRNDERKRLDVLFSAFHWLSDPNARLVIVGGGIVKTLDKKHALEALQQKDKRVIVIEQTDDVLDYHRAADIFVLLSSREGQPNALLEAMACGVPVVATAIPGVTECVRHGEEGFLVPVDNAAAAHAAIATLASSPHLRDAMGAVARTNVRLHHDIGQVAGDYVRLYESLQANTGMSSLGS